MTPDERTEWLQSIKVGDAVLVWERAPKADAHYPGLVYYRMRGEIYVSVQMGDHERTIRFRRSTGQGIPKPTATWQSRYTLEPMPKE